MPRILYPEWPYGRIAEWPHEAALPIPDTILRHLGEDPLHLGPECGLMRQIEPFKLGYQFIVGQESMRVRLLDGLERADRLILQAVRLPWILPDDSAAESSQRPTFTFCHNHYKQIPINAKQR